jgi:EmrB/QacA subfamily drug resistance transporter
MATASASTTRMTTTQRWTMVAAVLGSGIVFLDSTVVNVALPRIGQDLHSSLFGVLEAQTYVYAGYLLTLSALLILAGALNDYYGRRRMFALGLAGFGITSLACGVAPTMELLILFRVLQGAAGALLVPGSLAIITATFDGEQQGRAFGIWAGASAATTTLGPFVGGLLVDSISWRTAFLINVPLVVLALYATLSHVAESRDEEASGHFDWLGAIVVAIAVGGLAFGAIRGQQREWQDTTAFVAIALGAVAMVALPILMLKRPNPLIPPHLFKSRNFTVTNISTLVIYGALYVLFYFAVLFVQGTLGYDAAAAGLTGLPVGIFLAAFSSRFGKLAARHGPRLFMSVGPAIMGLGVLWLLRIPAASEAWRFGTQAGKSILPPADYWVDLFPMYVVFSIGLTMMVAPLTTALMQSVPKHNSGVASAINNSISRVGPQLAGAAIFVAIAASFYAGIGARVPNADTGSAEFRRAVPPLNQPDQSVAPRIREAAREASTHSFHIAMAIAAGLLFAGAMVNGVGIRNPKKVGVRPGIPGGHAPRVLHHSPRGPAHIALVPAAEEVPPDTS